MMRCGENDRTLGKTNVQCLIMKNGTGERKKNRHKSINNKTTYVLNLVIDRDARLLTDNGKPRSPVPAESGLAVDVALSDLD